MAGPTTDILMKFHANNAITAVPAESTLTIDPGDLLATNRLSGFTNQKYISPAFVPGSFCLIDQFNFGTRLLDKESGASKAKEQADKAKQEAERLKKAGHPVPKTTPTETVYDPAEAEFARWRSAKQWNAKNNQPFANKTGEFSFSRRIDKASPILFQSCVQHERLKFVTILKRVAARAGNNPKQTEEVALGYFRIDFSDVMITGIDWNDGDVLEEKCKFEARTMVISYLSKNDDGTLSPIPSITWAMKVGDDDVADSD